MVKGVPIAQFIGRSELRQFDALADQIAFRNLLLEQSVENRRTSTLLNAIAFP